jgi:hypothetical protein
MLMDPSEPEEDRHSRRSFLVKLGLGVAGLAGLSTGLVRFDTKEVSSAPASQLRDPFGITQLHSTRSGGPQWDSRHWANGKPRTIDAQGAGQFGDHDPYDPTGWSRVAGGWDVHIDGRGIMFVQASTTGSGAEPRFYINPATRGDPLFRNTEFTFYYRRVNDRGLGHSGAYGGVRSDPNNPHSGNGVNCVHVYYARLSSTGNGVFVKELTHPAASNGASVSASTLGWSNGMPRNTWIGWKFVCYDVGSNSVQLNLYRDRTGGVNGGSWQLVLRKTDNGSPVWTTSAPCLPSPHIIRQNGYAMIRNSGIYRCDYKWASIREINPPV